MIQKPNQVSVFGLKPLQILLICLMSFSCVLLVLVVRDILFVGLTGGFIVVLIGLVFGFFTNLWVLCLSVPVPIRVFFGLTR